MARKSPMKLVDAIFDLDRLGSGKDAYIRAFQRFEQMKAEVDEAIAIVQLRLEQFESGDFTE